MFQKMLKDSLIEAGFMTEERLLEILEKNNIKINNL